MSYGFDLIRLPNGLNRDEACRLYLKEREETRDRATDRFGSIDPGKEQSKQRLAQKLIARYPWLQIFLRNYAEIAQKLSVSESEARRRFRNIELNGHAHSLQILLFDNEAGVNFSPGPNRQRCDGDLRVLWDCLRTLESEGGFSTYDPQIGKLLNLDSDFED